MGRIFEVIPKGTAVVTSTYVVHDKLPILYISREYDDEGEVWQFHCGNDDYDMSKMLLVSIEDIYAVDTSIDDVYNLPLNSVATRDQVGSDWIYSEL